MSCKKKTNQEIEKQINIEQEFADLRFRDMRSSRYGLSPCCPLEKLEKITSRKEICDWNDSKLPVYLDKSYIDSTKTGYESYKWLFENEVIPDWVQKVCKTCDPISSTVITTTSLMTLNMATAVIDADVKLIRDTTKIYILAKYDGTISANQTSTYFTVGYGVVPAATLDMSIIVYGNTNATDPKNGADIGEVLTIIIDTNGDGSELLQIESTSISGWNPNQYTPTVTRTLADFGTKAPWCTFGISTDCTFCGEASTPDLDMYFYYDGTSMGGPAVVQAWETVQVWVGGLRAIGSFTGNVYHSIIRGERWLDWATASYTGALNNAGTCGLAGGGTPDFGDGGGVQDAHTPTSATEVFWGVLDYFQNSAPGAPIEFYGGLTSGTNVVFTGGAGALPASGNNSITTGLAPIVSTKEVLMVCFADESTTNGGPNQPYHSSSSSTPTWNLATQNSSGTATGTAAGLPTPCWVADYNKFTIEHNKHLAKGVDYKASYYMYVSRPPSGAPGDSRVQFPLHVIGAIESGDNPVGSGILTTAPTSSLASLAQATTGTNPYVANNVGRLDLKGWGYDVSTPVAGFDRSHFVNGLEGFWDPGDQECVDDAECVIIYVKDIAGNAIECYPIYIDNREVGITDENGFYVHTEYFASVNKNHSIDLCHCFTTTGACNQQRIDITVTPEETKVVCTPLTVDCTPET